MTRGILLCGALVLLALLSAGCSYSGDYGGVYVYGGAGANACEAQPLPERHTPTSESVTPIASRTPPPTFTMIPSPTRTPESWCVLLVTEKRGLNKRGAPSTSADLIGAVGIGGTIQASEFVQGDQYLWAYDVNYPPGWVAVRNRGVWGAADVGGCISE